jgi:hypothetical protein
MPTVQTLFGTFDDKQLKELKGAISEINEHMFNIKQKQNQIKEIVDVFPPKTPPVKDTSIADIIKVISIVPIIDAIINPPTPPTPTTFPIVDIPPAWTNPPATTVASFKPLPPINFGNRNLLKDTQWEKFLDPNYGQVPQPVQYSQPSNLSYNDLMGILGSKQGMPSRSSLSINDVISGIQNQYGQVPTSTMG